MMKSFNAICFLLLFSRSHAFVPLKIRIPSVKISHLKKLNSLQHLHQQNGDPFNKRKQIQYVAKKVKNSIMLPALSISLGYIMKVVIRKWIRSNAGLRFQQAGGWFGIYATIPILSGIVNMVTNKLAVWMIFNPIEFMGIEFVERREGQPVGFIGWQGIVPCKVRKMGNDVAETLLSLIDLRKIFSRLSSEKLATDLLHNLVPVCDEQIRTLIKPVYRLEQTSPIYNVGKFYTNYLKLRLKSCLVRIITVLQQNPAEYLDLKTSVVNSLVLDKKIIVELFQKCGREELKFIVTTGLWGGFILGLLQMLFWIIFPQPWTLIFGGALVGYATDFFALKILFEPVEPINFLGLKLHGLFLQRQKEVSIEFAHFMVTKLLTPEQLWNTIAFGTRSRKFHELVREELKAELSMLLSRTSEEEWNNFADTIIAELPRCAKPTHQYMESTLCLEETIRHEMQQMKCAAFERVLHPIFQEDELTLILVGTFLGSLCGAAQLPFY